MLHRQIFRSGNHWHSIPHTSQESLQFTITYMNDWSLFKKKTQFRNRTCPVESLMSWNYVWWNVELLWPTMVHGWLSATVCENLCTNRRRSGRHVLWMPEQTKTHGLNYCEQLERQQCVHLHTIFINNIIIYMPTLPPTTVHWSRATDRLQM